MGKLIKNLNYLYCLFIILICGILIIKSEALAKILLVELKQEVLPMTEGGKSYKEYIMTELFPVIEMCKDNEEYIAWESETAFSNQGNEPDLDSDDIWNKDELFVEGEEEVAMTIGTPIYGGTTYAMEDLRDFEYLVSNCYIVANSTSVNPEELNAENLLSMDMSIDLTSDDYKVLIYHTHGSETFADSREGVTEDTVIGVGDELTRILEEDYGIKVYHDRNVYDMVDGVLDRSYAYDLSGEAVDNILEEYPSIEVIIDLHRDGVDESVHLVTNIDGRDTAKVMFVNGVSRLNVNGEIEELSNPNKIGNLAFSLQMLLEGKALYENFFRNIYVTGYCYNLDRLPRSALVEVGAQTNTVEEAKNAMTPLAAVIYSVLSEK